MLPEEIVKQNKDVVGGLTELILEGLQTDGAHHKQWFLAHLLVRVVGEHEAQRTLIHMQIEDCGITP